MLKLYFCHQYSDHTNHLDHQNDTTDQAQDDIRAKVVTNDNETLVCDFSLVYRN